MGTTGATKIPMGNGDIADDSETTVEIKIKTLDSQTYTIRVNKCVPVPALKEQIAIVTGVLSEQQRLICRGRVLKDDELLSAYHVDLKALLQLLQSAEVRMHARRKNVEDGHTLHLVARQPHQLSSTSVGSEGQSANSSLDNIPNHSNQVSRTVVLEAVNIDQADMNPTFLNRIMANILSSFGAQNNGSGNSITNRDGNSERLPRPFGDTGVSGSQNQPNTTSQISQNILNISSQRIDSDRQHADFQFPSVVSSGPQNLPAIPHSLTTLHQYLAHLKNVLRREISGSNDRDNNRSGEASTAHHNEGGDYYISQSHHSSMRDDLPSPAALAEILQLTRHLLAEHVEERLLGLARELENDTNITDYLMRLNVQSSAIRTGYFLQNFGSLLLELGRTTMTLRMGQVPSETVVNSGPAVFISASGPNPVMVQPVPFYPAPSFGGMNTGPTISDHVPEGERVGPSSFPRNIDIRIHAVPIPASMQSGLGGSRQQQESLDSTRTSAGADSINQPVQGQVRGPTLTGEYGLRVVPVRTVVAMPAAIGNSQANLPGNLVPLLHPLLSRVRQQNGGSVNEVLTPQAFSVHQGSIEANQEPIPDSVRQILESYVRGSVQEETQAGSYTMATNSGPNMPLTAQNELQGTVYVTGQHLPNGYNERSSHVNDDNDPGQVPLPQNPNILNHSSTTMLVGDQANTVGVELQGLALGSQTEEARAEGDADFSNASIAINDQGVLFSNFLRQLMPLLAHDTAISQDASSVPSNPITLDKVDLNDPSSSQHPRDFSELPSSKRHKRE